VNSELEALVVAVDQPLDLEEVILFKCAIASSTLSHILASIWPVPVAKRERQVGLSGFSSGLTCLETTQNSW